MQKNLIKPENIEEYKNFAFNKNMVGVAIGLVLATAFQKTVTGISDYLIMPIVNYFIGNVDGNWRNLVFHPLQGMNIEIGKLIGTIIDFVIITLVLFLLYKTIIKRLWPNIKIETEKK